MLCAASVARAQVLEQVPSDALAVLKVNNLQSVSQKLAKFCQDLGIAAMQPEMNDPLAALQQHSGMQQGLNKDGEMAVVILDPQSVGGAEKAVLLLVPVSDYKAFVGNFPDAKEEAGVSQITFPDHDEPGFVANWGKFAAISPVKEAVTKKPSGLKIPGAATNKEMGGKDLVIMANLPAMKARFGPQLQNARPGLIQQIERATKNEPQLAQMQPFIKTMADTFLNGVQSMLEQGQSASFSLNFGNEGISTTSMAEFTPGSAWANSVASLKGSGDPMLTGLPQSKYMFLAGLNFNPEGMTKVFDQVTAPMLKELDQNAAGDKGQALHKWFDDMRKMIGSMKGQTTGLLAPQAAAGGQEPLIQFISVSTGDAKTIKSLQKDMIDNQQKVMEAFGVQQPMKASFTANAKKVGDVSFDQITNAFDADAAKDNPQMAMAEQMMKVMYGPNGMQMFSGVVGDKLVVASGVSDEMLKSAVDAVKSNAPLNNQMSGIAGVTKQLPPQRMAEGYVALDQIIATGVAFANQNGMNFQLNLPPDLPPIGWSVAVDGSAVRLDHYMPTQLIQSLVAAAMQIGQQMGGGGKQPGGPGGL